MADAFAELIEDGDFLDGLNDLSGQQEAVNAYFQSPAFQDYFNRMAEAEKECSNLRLEDGRWKMTIGDKDVDLDGVKEYWGNGNYDLAFDDCGFDPDDEVTKQTLNTLNDAWAQTPKAAYDTTMKTVQDNANLYRQKGFSNVNNLQDMIDIGNQAGLDLSSESNAFDDAKADINPEDPTTWQKMQDWIEEKGGALKDFIKNNIFTIGFIVALAFLAKDLYEFIKSVQHALSGCWSYMNGSKGCKIDALTCDDADLVNSSSIFGSSSQGFTICTACTTDPTCSSGGGDWIPALKGKVCQCDPSGSHGYLAGYNPLADTGTNPCTGFNNPNCPINSSTKASRLRPRESKFRRDNKLKMTEAYKVGAISVQGSTAESYACPYASGCVARSEACQSTTNSDCSSWCDPTIVLTKTGQSLTCTQCDFSCGLSSVLGNLFPSGVLGDIEKVLLYAALAIIGLVILYVVGKGLVSWITGKDDKQKVQIEVTQGKSKI